MHVLVALMTETLAEFVAHESGEPMSPATARRTSQLLMTMMAH
jgi:hypothetical protein